MFEIFRDAGVNYVRLRVWNCPFRTDENGKILYVDDEGNGTYERKRKKSFGWYKKVIATNGEDLSAEV